VDVKRIPNHVGIIMDGNGRWATKRGLPRSMGHSKGAENLEKLIEHIFNSDIKVLSLYAFSTENFNRDKEEVDYLMNLFIKWFKKAVKNFNKANIKVLFSGRRDRLNPDVVEAIKELEYSTKDNTKGIVNFAVDYGGQYEIVDMVKNLASKVMKKEILIDNISSEMVNKCMYNELPPLDFVIRTSGEQRISNFMLWQSAYAEYYFPDTLFPDFNIDEFDKSLIEFGNRNRRFGGKKNENKGA